MKTKFHKSIKYIIFEKHDDWKFMPYYGIENFFIQEGYDIWLLPKKIKNQLIDKKNNV